MPIGKLDIAMTLDAAGVSKGVKQATKQMNAFGVAVGTAFGQLAANAITKFGSAMVETFNVGLERMEAFNNAANRLGQGMTGGTQLKALADGLNDLGADTAAAQNIVESFANTVGNMLAGKLKGGAKTLKELGVAVVDTTGKVRPLPMVFQDTVDAINQMPSAAQRATTAAKIFGAETKEMAGVLNTVPGAIEAATAGNLQAAVEWQEFAATMETIGDGLGQFFQRDLPNMILPFFNDFVDMTRQNWDLIIGVWNAAVAAIAPAIDSLKTAYGNLMSSYDEMANALGGWDVVAAAFVAGIATMIEIIAQIIGWFADLISAAVQAGKAIAGVASAGAALAGGDLAGAAKAWGDAGTDWQGAVDGINKVLNTKSRETAIGDTWNKAFNGMMAGANEARKVNSAAAMTTKQAWGATIPTITSVGEMQEGLGDFWTGEKGGGGMSAAAKKAEEFQSAVEALAQTINDGVEPQRVYNEQMAIFNAAVAQGITSADNLGVAQQLAAEKAKAAAAAIGAAATPMEEFGKGLESWGNTVASSLADAIVEGENLEDVFKSLIKQLIKMAIELLVLKPLMQSITGGFSSMMGGGSFFAAPAVAAASPAAGLRALPRVGASSGGRSASTGSTSSSVSMGAMTINIGGGGEGSGVEANSARGRAFGIRIRGLVQTEMVKQSRPGGLLWQGAK